jgi:type I restriction-modification system, S subunit
MTPEQLKASILQYAIQGKLVEQRVEEGTGEELYQQIQAEKQRLIQEKKIKKEKPLAEISEDEVPFDIPESWKWVKVGNVGSWSSGATPSRTNPAYYGGIIPWLKTGDLNDGFIKKIPEFITDLALEKTSVRLNPVGSVLMAMYGATIGKLGILDISATTNQACCACIPYEGIHNKYLFYYLMSMRRSYIGMAEGGAQPNISKEKIVNSLIPLPPLAEQKRIVAKIEELLPLIGRYAVAYEKLEQFNAKFPEDMKKSILQYAIQGKLVEQRPEEGTGEELYQQIQAEKQHLIAEKKIKKEKPLPEIAENEIPFDIPESWKWVRLNNIAESIVDCPHSTPKYLDMETEYCTIDTNCIDGKGDITKWRYVDADTYTARIARLTPQKDDIVYTREGSICRAAILPEGPKVCLGQRVMLIRSANGVFPQFIRRLLMSPMVIRKLTEQQKGIGAKHVNVSDVCNLILPLPPLAEQERIVAKLEEILPLCERLK